MAKEIVNPEALIATEWGGSSVITEPTWSSITLGQNKKIQEVAEAALKASALLEVNLEWASTGIRAAGILLKGALNPPIILLEAVADEIDKFMSDFRNIGFYMLEVGRPDVPLQIPMMWDGESGAWAIVSMPVNAASIVVNMANAAAQGLTLEYSGWAAETLGEYNIYLTGAQKTTYQIPVKERGLTKYADSCWSDEHTTKEECEAAHSGMWFNLDWKGLDPSSKGTAPPKTGQIGEIDKWTGLPKINPSLAIATIISAIDDPYDKRRPIFSTSAQTGGLLIMVGMADFTQNLATIADVLRAIITFFGGSKQGIVAGISKTYDLVLASLGQLNEPAKNSVTLEVTNVCEMIGNEDQHEQWEENRLLVPDELKIVHGERADSYVELRTYNGEGSSRPHLFEQGDYIAVDSGIGTYVNGWVARVVEVDGELATYDDKGLATQTLEIIPLNPFDARMLKNPKGHKLVKVAYHKKEWSVVDDYGWTKVVEEDSFKTPEELVKDWKEKWGTDDAPVSGFPAARHSKTKAQRYAGDLYCSPDLDKTYDATMEVTEQNGNKTTYLTRIVGDIVTKSEDGKKAQPPNFTSVKLEDILQYLDKFFSGISGLTESMRQIAADMTKKIDEIIEYLEAKIKELEEINEALQKILRIFAEGLPATGIYVLNIPVDVGGNEYIKGALQTGQGRPPDSLDFTISLFLMYGAPGAKLIELLVPEDE